MFKFPIKRSKFNKNNIKQALESDFLEQMEKVPISKTLQENKLLLQQLFESCSDFVMKEFEIEKGIPALAVFVDGLTNTDVLNDALRSLMIVESGEPDIQSLNKNALPVSQTQKAENYKEFLMSVLSGDTGILIEKNNTAILLGVRGATTRSISEPETEAVIRGPREGLVESIRTNTSMIRRKLKTPRLKMKSVTVGKLSNTSVVITYIDGIVDPALVDEVVARIDKINIDAILESSNIEELIQDNVYSPFPQIRYTERPDTICAAILDGRVAILVDGSPFAIIAPSVFWDFMSATEDLYERFMFSTLLRWLRYLFLIVSLLTPAIYVAAITYHHDLLPTSLMRSIAGSREPIPFPAVVEALILEITFEGLREAGVRLPKTIGQTVSILGALVIGQAAVEAGIVSAPMVIVVSITGIASFTIPRFNGAIAVRVLRFPFLICGSIFGVFGIIMLGMIIIGHMANLRSFGIPYLSPAAPMNWQSLKAVLIKEPLWQSTRRPIYLPLQDRIKQGGMLNQTIQRTHGQTGANIKHQGDSDHEQ